MLLEITLLGGAYYAMKKDSLKKMQQALLMMREEANKAIALIDEKLKPAKKPKLAKKVKPSTNIEDKSKPDQLATNKKFQDLETIKLKQENQKMTRYFAIATNSTTFSLVGAYPPWYLLSLPGWLYVSMPAFERAFGDMNRGKINVNQIYGITALGYLKNGYYITDHFAALFYILDQKLLIQLKQDSHNSLINAFSQEPKTVFRLVDEMEVETAGETIPTNGFIINTLEYNKSEE